MLYQPKTMQFISRTAANPQPEFRVEKEYQPLQVTSDSNLYK